MTQGEAGDASGPPQYLFVYGTLMSASDHPMARMLAAAADRLGEASCAGWLYLVEDYPGLVDAEDSHEVVFGELFRLRDASVLSELDAYEGCGPGDPQPTLYVRELRHARLPDGTPVEAWVYRYNRPVSGLRRIVSGRFPAS